MFKYIVVLKKFYKIIQWRKIFLHWIIIMENKLQYGKISKYQHIALINLNYTFLALLSKCMYVYFCKKISFLTSHFGTLQEMDLEIKFLWWFVVINLENSILLGTYLIIIMPRTHNTTCNAAKVADMYASRAPNAYYYKHSAHICSQFPFTPVYRDLMSFD